MARRGLAANRRRPPPRPAPCGRESSLRLIPVRAGAAPTAALLRSVIDALPCLVAFVTADERYGFVNCAYEHWFGVPREQLLGRSLREFIGEAAYAALAPYVRRGLAGEELTFEQHGVPYRLGGTRDIKVTFVPHRGEAGTDEAGAVDGYIAMVEDITVPRLLRREREQASGSRW